MANYLKLAVRTLKRRSFYTLLNIFGLSLGMSCAILLFLFIKYHLSFDQHHRQSSQIYRVVVDLHLDDGSVRYEKGAPLAIQAAIKTAIPQVTDNAFLFNNFRDHSFTVSVAAETGIPPKQFAEHGSISFTDKHWFNLFDYEWETGNPQTALEQPNTAVLTREFANKYFGNVNPIGKILRIDGHDGIAITGILKMNSHNTDAPGGFFLSLSTLKNFYASEFPDIETQWGWINSSNWLYVLLPKNLSQQKINTALNALSKEHLGDVAKYYDFHLQPLEDVHFNNRYGGMIPKSLLTTLGLIGLIILVIACVNFINLATAQNSRRAKEVSTRKILGSNASAIFWQFILETVCIIIAATLFALIWVLLALPVLNQWLQTSLQLHLFSDRILITALITLILFIVLAAGVYPAILLSSFKPVELLKTRTAHAKQPWLRKSLIVFQNLVAQSLIICTLIIVLQTNFIKNANLGFNQDAVIMVPLPKADKNDLTYFRNQLLTRPGIRDASFCFRPPASEIYKAGSVKFDNRDWEKYTALSILGDSHYVKTFGLQLIAGRNLAESDTTLEFLVTPDLISKLGYKEPSDVLGHRLIAGALDDHPGTIVGVVNDIHLHSLRSSIEPLLISSLLQTYAYAGIKINGGNTAQTIDHIKRSWEAVYPGHVFEFHFLDEQIGEFYKNERLLNRLIGSFAVLAIIISCVGLLGLISLLTIQRTKEIGIRKVIGASVTNIAVLISTDFAKLVSLAFVLASLFCWVVMNNWLQGFAYRIAIPWWIFLIAGAGNFILVMLTICYHAIRAASLDPVETLRGE